MTLSLALKDSLSFIRSSLGSATRSGDSATAVHAFSSTAASCPSLHAKASQRVSNGLSGPEPADRGMTDVVRSADVAQVLPSFAPSNSLTTLMHCQLGLPPHDDTTVPSALPSFACAGSDQVALKLSQT